MAQKKTPSKKKKDIRLSQWILKVHTTSNNTIISLVSLDGAVVIGRGAGTEGFKGSKKSTPYAAEMLAKSIIKEGNSYGLLNIGVVFKGTGMAREWIFKAINETGLVEIDYIHENTSIQFGGCKRPRPKRN